MLNPLTEQWEAELGEYCQRAALSAVQREIVLLFEEGMSESQVKLKLHLGARNLRMDLQTIRARLRPVVEELERPAREFPRVLVMCAANKRIHDERPPDLRGVTPDRSSDRFQGARMVPGDDRRLVQDDASTLTLWLQANRPALVSALP